MQVDRTRLSAGAADSHSALTALQTTDLSTQTPGQTRPVNNILTRPGLTVSHSQIQINQVQSHHLPWESVLAVQCSVVVDLCDSPG